MAFNALNWGVLVGRAKNAGVYDRYKSMPIVEQYAALQAADARGELAPPRGELIGKIVTVAGSALTLGAAAPAVIAGAGAIGGAVTSTAGASVGLWEKLKSAASGVVSAGVDALKEQGGKIVQNALSDATARLEGAKVGVQAANTGANVAAGVQQLAQSPIVIAGGLVVLAVALSKLGD